MAIPTEVWLPIATFALGSIVPVVAEAIRDQRRCRREDDLRNRELMARVDERKAEHYRKSLSNLKKEITSLVRTVMNPPEELSFGWFRAVHEGRVNILTLAGTLNDADAVASIEELLAAVEKMAQATDVPNESGEALDHLLSIDEKTSRLLGKHAREAA